MKRLLFLLLLITTSCSSVPDSEPVPATVQVSDSVTVTNTPVLIPTPVSTVTPFVEPTLTQTPVSSCDPWLEDYCVYPYKGILQPPFYAPDRYYLDQIYNYGSTDFGAQIPHHGVDFENPTGTQVYASGSGSIIFAGNDHDTLFSPWPDFYGNLVLLEHIVDDKPVYTLYAHLSQIDVREGDQITAGNPIGKVGASGSAIGGHLHLEVRQDDYDYSQTGNPELWLVPYETNGVRSGYLAARIINGQDQFEHVLLTVEFYNFKDGTAPAVWKASYETYLFDAHPVGQDDRWHENFAQGGLWPGFYKITVLKEDRAYERWIEVLPEHLTYFILIVD